MNAAFNDKFCFVTLRLSGHRVARNVCHTCTVCQYRNIFCMLYILYTIYTILCILYILYTIYTILCILYILYTIYTILCTIMYSVWSFKVLTFAIHTELLCILYNIVDKPLNYLSTQKGKIFHATLHSMLQQNPSLFSMQHIAHLSNTCYYNV